MKDKCCTLKLENDSSIFIKPEGILSINNSESTKNKAGIKKQNQFRTYSIRFM